MQIFVQTILNTHTAQDSDVEPITVESFRSFNFCMMLYNTKFPPYESIYGNQLDTIMFGDFNSAILQFLCVT